MFSIDKDTNVCISISSRPSNFGTTIHNAAYRALGLNFIYKAFGVSDIVGAMAGVRALGIRGCSVSMPFKEKVIEYLDNLDETANAVGAVNTIVNENGYLKGYNTDVFGAKVALKSLEIGNDEKILVLGAGGAAKAIIFALGRLGLKQIFISNRTRSKLEYLHNNSFEVVPWSDLGLIEADILINATSVGMQPNIEEMPVDIDTVKKFRAVMDVVLSPWESKLISEVKKMNKLFVPGYKMSLHQAAAQFELYTGESAPLDVMENAMLKLLGIK